MMAVFSMRLDVQSNKKITKKGLLLKTNTIKRKNKLMKRKCIQQKLKKLKTEMEEIGEEQKSIRQGQRQVREKFEAIEAECEQLKTETKMIIQQSAITQIKLAIMFRIIKSKEDGDFSTAETLTHLLRSVFKNNYSSTEGNSP